MSENSKECLSSLSCMSIVFMHLLAKLNDWIGWIDPNWRA